MGSGISMLFIFKKFNCGDFPGGPEVKTALPLQGGMGLIPGQVTKIQHAMWRV